MFDVARAARRRAARGEDARRPVPVQNNIDASRQLHRRRPDPRRAAAPVQRLRRGQLHRGHAGHLLLPDRRDEVRQADHRPRGQRARRRCSTPPSARWCRSTRRCARTSRSDCRSTCWCTKRTRCASSCSGASTRSDPYFQMVHTQWGEGLRRVFAQLPDPTGPGARGALGRLADADSMAIRVALLAPHDLPVRPAGQPVAARDPPAARAALPHAGARLLAEGRAGRHFLNWQQDPYGNWVARLVFTERADQLDDRRSTSSPT